MPQKRTRFRELRSTLFQASLLRRERRTPTADNRQPAPRHFAATASSFSMHTAVILYSGVFV